MRRFTTPDLDSNTHESMVRIFNNMLDDIKSNYEVVFIDEGEALELQKKSVKLDDNINPLEYTR